MATKTGEIFQATEQKTGQWLRELAEIGKFRDEGQAYSALRAVLHALRDRLTTAETAQLSAQLPMLVRGFYYEGWKPTASPTKLRTKEEFLDAVRHELRDGTVLDLDVATRAVFTLIDRKISEGEVEDIKRILPEEIREFFA